jgi:hypothetical protein
MSIVFSADGAPRFEIRIVFRHVWIGKPSIWIGKRSVWIEKTVGIGLEKVDAD